LLVDIQFADGHSVCWWTLSLLVDTPFAGGHSVCWWTLPLLVDTQFAGGHSLCWLILSLLVDTPFAGGHSVCWWTLTLLVDTHFAGGHSLCWLILILLVDTPFAGWHSVCWWTLPLLVDTPFAGGHSLCWWTFSLLVDTPFAGGHSGGCSFCKWTPVFFFAQYKQTPFVALGTWHLVLIAVKYLCCLVNWFQHWRGWRNSLSVIYQITRHHGLEVLKPYNVAKISQLRLKTKQPERRVLLPGDTVLIDSPLKLHFWMLPACILFVTYDVWMNRIGCCWFTHNCCWFKEADSGSDCRV